MTSFSSVVLLLLCCLATTKAFSCNSRSACSLPHTHIISTRVHSRGECSMRWGMKTSETLPGVKDGVALRDTVPFELRGFSLPLVVFSVGAILTASSFAGFFLNDGNSDGAVSSLGFVYGIPVFLIGLSLWYAEIPPVPVITSEAGDRAWEKHASDTFQKIKQDVTRHRYGDDAHLDSTLTALGLRLPQKKYPRLVSLTQEEDQRGQLVFTLTFQSVETPYKIWAEPARVRRYAKFFGPNVRAEVIKVDAAQRLVAIKLTTIPEEEFQQLLNSPIEQVAPEETASESAEQTSQ